MKAAGLREEDFHDPDARLPLAAEMALWQRYGRLFHGGGGVRFQEGRPEVAFAVCHPALSPGHWLAQDYRLTAVLALSRGESAAA